MFGRDIGRTFAYPSSCDTALTPDTVPRLRQKWFLTTSDVVTATPAVVDDTAFVGDWSGRFYAISLTTGKTEWTFDGATAEERVLRPDRRRRPPSPTSAASAACSSRRARRSTR